MAATKIVRLALTFCTTLVAVSCGRDVEVVKHEHFERGNGFFAEKKYGEAIIEYRNAVRQDGKFGEARYRLAESLEATGDAKQAFREFIRAADVLADSTKAQLKAATYLILADQFEDARTRTQRVLDRDPTNVEALILHGNALAGLRDFDGAVKQVEEAIEVEPGRGLTYTNLALVKLAKGQRDEAGAAFEKAVDLAPRSVPALLALANFQWGVGDVAKVEQTLKHALAVEPTDLRANRALAALYVGTNRPAEAEQPLKTIAETASSDEARFDLADYYVASKRFDAAKMILQPLVERKETFAAARSRLAQLEYALRQTARAHVMLDEVLAREPGNATALLIKGRWLFSEGKRAEGLAKATAAVQADLSSVPGHYILGSLQAATHDIDGAVNSFREVLRLNPNLAAAQLQLSRLELVRGHADNALALAEAALTTAPDNAEARLAAAWGMIVGGQLSRAEPALSALLKAYPNEPAVHSAQGALRLAGKDLAGARESYTRAAQLYPESVDALSGLTSVDVAEGKFPAARARVEARLANEPKRAELLVLAAKVYIAAGDPASAEQPLRRAIEVAPSDMRNYTLLAQVYFAQRKLDSAKAEFDAIADRNPKDVPSRTMAAVIVHAQNNVADAKARYQRILELNPKGAVAANNLASIYADEKDNLVIALRLAQTAAQELPNQPEVHDTLGWVYYQMELPLQAIAPFEKSIATDPSNPLYHYHLGLAQLKAGDSAKARTSLEHALKLEPNFAQAVEARKVLLSLPG
jgi:putative PEP-CTERM system TPR-repeat lipoprotein